MNRLYIGLAELKRDWLPDLDEVEGYDDRVVQLVREVSGDIEEACKPHTKTTPTHFIPVTETRAYDHAWDTSWLRLDQWLLSVDNFTTENGNTDVSASDYHLLQNGNANELPYNLVLMADDGNVPALLYTGTVRKANSITGKWGYCNTTEDTETTLDGTIDGSQVRFDVKDGSLIEVGWTLLVENEQMFVEERNTNALKVKREQNGTTAASHSGTAVYRYKPPADIVKLCGISVARLYHRGTTAFADTTGTPPTGLPYIAANVPDALMIINRYRREKWW